MVLLGERLPTHFINDKQNANVALLIIQVHATMLTAKSRVFEPFLNLIRNPVMYEGSFFPTMPDDDDYDAYQVFKSEVFKVDIVKFYLCPSGHMYTIGDCTKPATTAVCPTCKMSIGGQSHQLIKDNKEAADLQDTTPVGYGPYVKQQVRSLSPINKIILRIILSCSLYIGALTNKADLKNLISAQFRSANQKPVDYFAANILADLKELSNCMQHSIDECLLLLHHLLNSSLNDQKNDVNISDLFWKTRQSRRDYEKQFCQKITAIFNTDSYEQIISDLTRMLRQDMESSDQLTRIAYDFIQPDNLVTNVKFLNEEKCWSYRVNISIEHMINTFHSKSGQAGQKELKLLNEFLSNATKLESIKYLPSLVSMINVLYTKFHRQIDRQQAKQLKLGEILSENSHLLNENMKIVVRHGASCFLTAWGMAKPYINSIFYRQLIDKIDVNVPELNPENLLQLPVSFLMSCSSKDGRYIYALVYYLAELQNDFVKFYRNHSSAEHMSEINLKTKDDVFKINCMEIKLSDCIDFTSNKDLLKIIYLCSNYSLSPSSKSMNIEYNFRKIQSEIEAKLLSKIVLIDNTVSWRFWFLI
jgi:hypothetical protein